jgi:trehalose 6-phosphate phosphatase
MDSLSTDPATVPESFWRDLAAAPQALLLLDYDGTLAPFRIERQRAVPYPGVRRRLRRLLDSSGTRLVIVSGRSAAEVCALLGLEPAPEIWGMHGFERRRRDGGLERRDLTAAARRVLAEATRLAASRLAPDRVERKPAAVACHWRGLAEGEIETLRREIEAALVPLLADSPMELHRFDGGLEVRPRGVDKGRAIARLLAEEDERAAVAYLGDDLTDEDAFRALGRRGLPVLVRREPRSTAARARLEPPHQLLAFLDRWIVTREESAHA